MERLLNAPVSKVWKALTEKDEMKNWYFQLDEFKAEKDSVFNFPVDQVPKNSIFMYAKSPK